MKWFTRLVAVLVLAGVAAMAARMGFNALLQASGPNSEHVVLVFAKGTGTADIGKRLAEAGLIERPALWPFEVKLSGRRALLAGEYDFPAHASLATIFEMMRHGEVVVHHLSVAEGLTVKQVEALLAAAPAVAGAVSVPPAEGSLLPSTYYYTYGDDRQWLVGRMQRGMTELLDDLWSKRDPGIPLADKEQALVLASIVERETAIADERPRIAAVFENRLRQHMRLQSDPTVIYVLSQGEGVLNRPLAHDDLSVASPYNTYASDGLPPGPICNPGKASLLAVLHPAQSQDLYFVADGSGGHVFAKTLAEHNQNVSRLRKLQQGK